MINLEKHKELVELKKEEFIREKLMSDQFLEFLRKNSEPYDRMEAYYRCAIMEVETKFKVLNEEMGLAYDRNPIESIKSRIKSRDSLIRKIRDKNIPLTIESIQENIKDIAGIRVVCSFPEDIYLLEKCLLRQDDVTLYERKDYIENPKPSGYRSLHLIIGIPIFLQNETKMMTVEIQLRTIAMDFWASLEHKLRYKKNIPDEQAEILAGELAECARISSDLDQRMQDIRIRLENTEEENRLIN